MVSIVILSDIRIYAEGLQHIFARQAAIDVLGAAADLARAQSLVGDQQPDVVLLDMTMPAPCELARLIVEASPESRIVALAVPFEEHDLLQCAHLGITGYILREASVEELVEAVVCAGEGKFYCPPKITACILNGLQAPREPAPPPATTPRQIQAAADDAPAPARLTRREQQIAALLEDGLSNKQIARQLNIEVSTVKNHVHNLLLKLEVDNRNQAASRLRTSRAADPDLSIGYPTPALYRN
ncbi:LuxR C-terminal-related transcriptional regulator [Mangrovimicrobium sediminis]|nr:response regulator transcription factor [Haliea sp. SAOS-164]